MKEHIKLFVDLKQARKFREKQKLEVQIKRLEREDDVQAFDCGDHELNDYLKRHAWASQQQNSVGVTYVAVDHGVVLGYYTLASGSILRDLLNPDMVTGLPRYRNLPVALLARLAVDLRVQTSGLGKSLLRDAFTVVLNLSRQIGLLYLIVDAYPTAVEWFRRFGFITIGEKPAAGTQHMLIDLRTVTAALIAGSNPLSR